jgi:glutathione S-transferase
MNREKIMLTLFQPPRPNAAWNGIPNMSPFCVKLEWFLKLSGLPFEIKPGNPLQAPKGKIPYIKDGDVLMGDSGLIIDYLTSKYQLKIDDGLTELQKAQAHVLRRAIEEGSYFYLATLRWSRDESFGYVKGVFQQIMPKPIVALVMPLMRKKVLKAMKMQGARRHEDAELQRLGIEDVKAYAQILGDQKFFLGDRPRSIDATMFGFLIQILWVPWSCPVKDFALKQKNLVDYCQRMKDIKI